MNFFFHGRTALVGLEPLPPPAPIIEASESHSHTPRSVELLWTSDQPVVETSTWQHATTSIKERDTHAPGSIRTRNPTERGHRGRL
jgi:hypothetical protein